MPALSHHTLFQPRISSSWPRRTPPTVPRLGCPWQARVPWYPSPLPLVSPGGGRTSSTEGTSSFPIKNQKQKLHSYPPPTCYKFFSVSEVKVDQLCLTLCDPMDCTVYGILQARILEWLAIPFSRGSSRPGDQTQVSHIAGGFCTS